MNAEELRSLESQLSEQFDAIKQRGLNLDLTRGKPSTDQLNLSNGLLADISEKALKDPNLRNYGGLLGIPEARDLFSQVIGVKPEETLVGGNSSLTLMYFAAHFAMHLGVDGPDSAWMKEGSIKMLAPVPGYDRHFSVSETLGIELIPVALMDDGPDMDEVERLVKADPKIKGIWCVPRFSNPTGHVYSDAVVERFAQLGKIAGPNFRIFWDNAYALHFLSENAPQLGNIMDACRKAGTEDSVYIFGSTSKITFAGAGVAFMGMSERNLANFSKHLGMTQIGPDKINQLRHVAFFRTYDNLVAHMKQHADMLKPRFDAVLRGLENGLSGTGAGEWITPEGGYFISFNTLPGLATEVVAMAADAGVKLTPAGATYPYGKDPDNKNIRIAPSVPSVADIEAATDVFVTCVKLATVRHWLKSA
ncbi:DNA-binding transcriptional MocR family regulator [Litorivivens lipolytica]|uniref:DNA-binding transcriptional MocR family regulator n=1 Tax=Litorivivens lipolytica TaxID=1524264 RepID=A0A7W4W472_9GAMM|nr:aminotransferase [Litorivivens lipolytica]MBB3047151.1 DNA-binding transcriptional MocR family regulator [Litorivivens lipolytica]